MLKLKSFLPLLAATGALAFSAATDVAEAATLQLGEDGAPQSINLAPNDLEIITVNQNILIPEVAEANLKATIAIATGTQAQALVAANPTPTSFVPLAIVNVTDVVLTGISGNYTGTALEIDLGEFINPFSQLIAQSIVTGTGVGDGTVSFETILEPTAGASSSLVADAEGFFDAADISIFGVGGTDTTSSNFSTLNLVYKLSVTDLEAGEVINLPGSGCNFTGGTDHPQLDTDAYETEEDFKASCPTATATPEPTSAIVGFLAASFAAAGFQLKRKKLA